MNDLDRRREEFGERLRQLRERAGFPSGKDIANHLGWQQSKVSRIETGRQLAADSDLSAWTHATGLDQTQHDRLRTELREVRLEAAAWKRQLRTSGQPRQQHASMVENAAHTIRAVETAIVPGLAQTPNYARAVLNLNHELHGLPPDVEATMQARMQRQHVLYDSTKTIELLMTEAALRQRLASPEIMAAQIDRLQTLHGLANVRFGILALDTPLPAPTPHGFWIIDDQVLIEFIGTEITLSDPSDVALHTHHLDALWNLAAEGEDARAILARTMTHYTR